MGVRALPSPRGERVGVSLPSERGGSACLSGRGGDAAMIYSAPVYPRVEGPPSRRGPALLDPTAR